ncbi:MAG: cellulase family glycosylhydrolase [Deltaproteobacteria bacterium]|nr:cellulase family glycosylhydrolase [Deltaproteobacteria bacterium]
MRNLSSRRVGLGSSVLILASTLLLACGGRIIENNSDGGKTDPLDGGKDDILPRADASPPGPDARIPDAQPSRADASARVDARPTSSDAGPPPTDTGWLRTEGNKILLPGGQTWHARGANIHDTRSCNACTWSAPRVGEVLRRVDALVDDWKANFMRLDLESYAEAGGREHYQSFVVDPQYMQDIRTIVEHVATKPGVYVMVSLWIEPTTTELDWPTEGTRVAWRMLAREFANMPHVLYGLVNEPQQNYSGALNAQVWDAMNQTVQAIRDVENELGTPHHIVAVQGTGGWARFLDYYITHPITAGNGKNVAYETHVYNRPSDFARLFIEPSKTLPVIIGEFGPGGSMTNDDVTSLMEKAEELEIPYLAWTFHQRCAPNLLVDITGRGCGAGMALTPTPWGQLFKDRLAQPY